MDDEFQPVTTSDSDDDSSLIKDEEKKGRIRTNSKFDLEDELKINAISKKLGSSTSITKSQLKVYIFFFQYNK